jgi:Flp pilus assembly protein TadD
MKYSEIIVMLATCLSAISSTVCAAVVIQFPTRKNKLAKLLIKGKEELDSGQYDKAAETFTLAANLDPNCMVAWQGRHEALQEEYCKK